MKSKFNLFIVAAALQSTVFGATIYKVDNTDNLVLTSSWTDFSGLINQPGSIGSSDALYFNEVNMKGDKTVALGGNLAVGGLAVDYVSSDSPNSVVINAGGVLTLNSTDLGGSGVPAATYPAAGIVLNRAGGGSLTINSDVSLGAVQQWFSGRATGGITVTGALNLNGFALSANIAGGTSTLSGAISGSGKFTKLGGGTLVLPNANPLTGNFQLGPDAGAVNSGVVLVGNAASLGTGTIVARGTQLRSSVPALVIANPISAGPGALRLGGTNDFTLSGTTTLDATRSIANYGTNTVTLGAISTAFPINFDAAAGKIVIGGVISGAGGINLSTANIVLNGTNTYTGASAMSGGRISGTGSVPTLLAMSGGSIALAGGATTSSLTLAGGVTFTNAPTIVFTTPPVASTTYDVFTYGSDTVTGIANLTTGYRGTIANDAVNKKYTFTLGAQGQTRTWNTTTGVWDRGITENFAEGDKKFYTGDNVIFGAIATDSTVTLTGTLLPASVVVSNPANIYTFSGTGVISGSTSLVKSGAGTLALASKQSYTGGTTVNAGVLDLTGGGGESGTIRGTIAVNSGATLRLSTVDAGGYGAGLLGDRLDTININGGTLDVNTVASPGGTANQTLGNATLNLTGGAITGIAGSNIDFYRGASTLNTLASATTSTISGVSLSPVRQGSTTFTVADGAAAVDLRIDSVLRLSPYEGDPADAVFTKAGAGVLQLTAVNTLSRDFAISAGTLDISGTGQLGSGNFTRAIANNGVLRFSTSANQTLSGVVSGTGSLVKSGTGNLILEAEQTYTGPTAVSGGKLTVIGKLDLASAVTVSGTGILAGDGFVDGDVTVNPGGSISAGVAGSGTNPSDFTLGSLTFPTTGTINIAEPEQYTNFDTPIFLDRNLVANGAAGSITVNLPPVSLAQGEYNLIQVGGSITATAAQFKLGTAPALGSRQAGAFKVVGDLIIFKVTGSNPIWTGALNGVWTTTPQANPKNWIAGINATDFLAGDGVVFDDSATGTTAVTLASPVNPKSVLFDHSSKSYSLSGAGGISGTGSLTKSGTGTLTLGTANSYSGGTFINGGILVLQSGGTLSSGTVELDNARLNLAAPTFANAIVTNNGTLGGGSFQLDGVISGTSLNIDATGFVKLNAVNTYTGATNVAAGGLEIIGAGQLGAGDYAGAITNPAALRFDTTANQILRGAISGVGQLFKNQSSKLTLTSQSAYTGGTTINGGILDLAGGGGASGTIRGSVTVKSGASLYLSTGDATGYGGGASSLTTINLDGGNLNVNVSSAVANETLGSGVVNMTGGSITGVANSNLDFFGGGSAVNTFASATTSKISGTAIDLRQAQGVTFTVAKGTTASGMDLEISSLLTNKGPAGGLPGTGENYGSNPLIKSGPGTLKITGLANNYTGSTTVNDGVLDLTSGQIYSVTYQGTAVLTINTGGVVKVNSYKYSETGGSASSLGALRDQSAARVLNGGTLEVFAASHSSGNNFTVGAVGGTFRYAPAVTTDTLTLSGNGNGNINVFGVLTLDAVGNVEINEIIDGLGSLTKTGGQTLTLSGANAYAGDTTVSGGTLAVNGSALPDTTSLIVTSGVVAATGTETVDTLYFGAVQQAKGTWGATGSSATHIDNVRFSGTAGVINVTTGPAVVGGYGTWAATNAPGQGAGGDFDNDGVSNGAEYVLGGLATTQDSGKLPKVTTAGGNLVFTFKRNQASKTADTTVAIEVGTTLASWPTVYTVGNDNSGSNAGSTPGVTVTDSGGGFDTVTLTVAQAPDAKKFARLKVTVN